MLQSTIDLEESTKEVLGECLKLCENIARIGDQVGEITNRTIRQGARMKAVVDPLTEYFSEKLG